MSKKKSSKKSEKSSKSDKHRRSSSRDPSKKESKPKKSKSKKEKHETPCVDTSTVETTALAKKKDPKLTLNLGYEDDSDDTVNASNDSVSNQQVDEKTLLSDNIAAKLDNIQVKLETDIKESKLNSKHSFNLSPQKTYNEVGMKISENTSPGPTNLLKTSIKSFSIKKVASLSNRSTLLTSSPKKPKIDKPTLTSMPDAMTGLNKEISDVSSLLVKNIDMDAIAVLPTIRKEEKPEKLKSDSKSSKRHSRSPRSSHSRKKRRSKSRSKSHSRSHKEIPQEAASTTISNTPTGSSPVPTPTQTPNTVETPTSTSKRTNRSSKRSTPTKRSRSRSANAKLKKQEKSRKRSREKVDTVEKKTTVSGVDTVVGSMASDGLVKNEGGEKEAVKVLDKSVSEPLNEQKPLIRTESSSGNLNSSRDRTHGSHHTYSSSRYLSRSTKTYTSNKYESSRSKRKYREYSSRSRSRSRSYSPNRHRSRSTSNKTTSRSRSSSYSSTYSESSTYSMKSKRRDKHEKSNRSRTSSMSTQQHQSSTSQYDPSGKVSSHRGSGYHHHHHHHYSHHSSSKSSSDRRYYSSNYRSGNYNSGSGGASSGRYLRGSSASKNSKVSLGVEEGAALKQSHEVMGMNNQVFLMDRPSSRSNTLRLVKTEGDMPMEQNIGIGYDQGFYRGKNNMQQINSNNRSVQKQPYHNHGGYQNSQMNSINKRYFNNNVPGISSISGQGSELLSQQGHSNGGFGNPVNNESAVGGDVFDIAMGNVSSVNLEDLQNATNNQSENSEFEYSSSEENDTLNMYHQETQSYSAVDTQLDWSILQQPRFNFIKNHQTTMFDSLFNTHNLAYNSLHKIPDILGSSKSYINLVRKELSGADLDSNIDSNNFILVNCLLNRSFSKIRLGKFFNVLNQCPERDDMGSRQAYASAEIERRQKIIEKFNADRIESVNGNGEGEGVTECLDECLELLTKEGLLG